MKEQVNEFREALVRTKSPTPNAGSQGRRGLAMAVAIPTGGGGPGNFCDRCFKNRRREIAESESDK